MKIIYVKIIICETCSTDYKISKDTTNSQRSYLSENKKWIPNHLGVFLETLIKKTLKQVTIGQAISHAVRPRTTLPTILFGLAKEMDHVFGFECLVRELNRFFIIIN